MRQFFSIIILMLFLSACDRKFSLQKRKYGKGFYLSVGGNVKLKSLHKTLEKINKPKSEFSSNNQQKSIVKVFTDSLNLDHSADFSNNKETQNLVHIQKSNSYSKNPKENSLGKIKLSYKNFKTKMKIKAQARHLDFGKAVAFFYGVCGLLIGLITLLIANDPNTLFMGLFMTFAGIVFIVLSVSG